MDVVVRGHSLKVFKSRCRLEALTADAGETRQDLLALAVVRAVDLLTFLGFVGPSFAGCLFFDNILPRGVVVPTLFGSHVSDLGS